MPSESLSDGICQPHARGNPSCLVSIFFWVMYEPSFLRRREFCPLFSSFGFSDKFLRFPGLDSRFRGNDGGWFLFF